MLASATGVLRRQGHRPAAAIVSSFRRALWMRQAEEMRMLEAERKQQEEQQQEQKETVLALPATYESREGVTNDADKRKGEVVALLLLMLTLPLLRERATVRRLPLFYRCA